MLTQEEVAAEATNLISGHLSQIAQRMIYVLFTQYVDFSLDSYPDIRDRLENVEGVDAQILLATLTKVEELGPGTVRLSGGSDGVDFDLQRDRDSLLNYALGVLYPRRDGGPLFGIKIVGAYRGDCY